MGDFGNCCDIDEGVVWIGKVFDENGVGVGIDLVFEFCEIEGIGLVNLLVEVFEGMVELVD